MEIDSDRIDDAVLALLYLGLHDRSRACSASPGTTYGWPVP